MKKLVAIGRYGFGQKEIKIINSLPVVLPTGRYITGKNGDKVNQYIMMAFEGND